jgi:hypothetical protein
MREKLSKYEYEYLTHTWQEPFGAAYNVVGEYCLTKGWCCDFGFVTPLGQRVIDAYEDE